MDVYLEIIAMVTDRLASGIVLPDLVTANALCLMWQWMLYI